eukprot:TRINITY_DN1810_c0_g1_i8.p1 TRINITY_DN1810_c0_g1~~TRINITY_DN1810_c0_g1_i8.p1  ORF type:complete len:474 (-),score=80.80 TRINITY_DN1810_c0_g1_i8:406-1827(-)
MQALNYPTDYYQQYQQPVQDGLGSVGVAPAAAVQQPQGLHSNVFIRNIPPEIDQNALQQMFATYGQIEHTRLVKNKNPTGNNYGFVKYASVEQAQLSISTMNNAQVGTQFLEVKLASYDSKETGGGISVVGSDGNFLGTPSENLYIRNLPVNYGESDLQSLFALYGSVLEVKILHPGDAARQGMQSTTYEKVQSRNGSRAGTGSALIRMGSQEEAGRAIEGLHGKPLPGSAQSVVLRYADTEEEKARKRNTSNTAGTTQTNISNRYAPYAVSYDQTQQQQHQQQQQVQMQQMYPAYDMSAYGYNVAAAGQVPAQVPAQVPGQVPVPGYEQYYQAAANNTMQGGNYLMPQQYPPAGAPQQNPSIGPQLGVPQQPQPMPQQHIETGQTQSVYVKNIPATEKDECELFLYRKFAPLGAIVSIFVMHEKDTGKARGVGFVNYVDGNSATAAIQQLNGLKVEDKILGVAYQNSKRRLN